MKFEYEFKPGPDPLNPNEQLAGSADLHDDRLYGQVVSTVSFGGQCYTRDYWTKPELSNKLTLLNSMTFEAGYIVVVETFC